MTNFLLMAMPIIGHTALGFVFGAIVGSFVNALSYRLPRGISMLRPRSSCPSCKAVLGIRDLVPILSYLWYRGKCSHCGVKFGKRYLTIELIVALHCAFAFGLLWGNWFLAPILLMIGTGVTRIVMRLEADRKR
jgi:prepilin signal peptidase PulO-like enzyme (type II secretory pathway)